MERHKSRGCISQHIEVRSRGRAHCHGSAFWIHLVVNETPLLQKSVYSMKQRDKLKSEELKPCLCLTLQKGDSKGRSSCFWIKHRSRIFYNPPLITNSNTNHKARALCELDCTSACCIKQNMTFLVIGNRKLLN